MTHKTVGVNKGLHVLRFESAPDVFSPPSARISVEPESRNQITLTLEPGQTESVLREPGSCMVVRANESGRLRVEIVPARPGGSIAATIKLQMLSAQRPELAAASRPARIGSEAKIENLRVRGHVAGRGDVVVGLNEWIAGPSAPARIEGFAIEWPDMPNDFSLRYAGVIGGSNPTRTDLVETGSFAGTRGRALPLVGVTYILADASAVAYRIAVEAMFLGCPPLLLSGDRIVLAGSTGREPLVGLKIGLKRVAPEAVSSPDPAPPSKPARRVKVFRGGAGASRTTPSAG